MSDSNCIPAPELAEFVRGKLDEARLDEVLSHVDQCEVCQDTVVALAGSRDTFVEQLRDVHQQDALEREGALRHGLQRLLAGIRSRRSSSVSEAPQPMRIGPYVIESQLGSGGMGTVYRAKHSKLKRTVALKVLPAQRWANAVAVSRFEREMEAIGGLDHPHIVRASDAGEDEGMHYLVMEFVEGLDLSRLTGRLGQLPLADACELARQAALGLQHAHDNGLVHRDIKPSNLMLAWDRAGARNSDTIATLKILDLGLALLGDEHLHEGHELTTVGALMGTLDYMSPEQGIDSHAVDHRADIYGLGATLFKLLSGRAPYADPKFSTLMKKMTALATKPAPSIAEMRADLPGDVAQLVDRMLARDPDQRFASARDVADALASAAKGADLRSLLKRGLEAEEPAEERGDHPAQLITGVAGKVAAAPLAKRRVYRPLMAVIAAGFALIAAGVVFLISTDYGEVVVRSDDPAAQLVIRRGDEEVQRLQLERGAATTRLRAGHYEVEIAGDVKELSVTPSDFQVPRRGLVQVRVQRDGERHAFEASTVDAERRSPTQGPRYDGRTLWDWLAELEFERKPERLEEALAAVAAMSRQLSDERLIDPTVDAVFSLLRQHGTRYLAAHGSTGALTEKAWHVLIDMPLDQVARRMVREFSEGNAQSRAAMHYPLQPVFMSAISDPDRVRDRCRQLLERLQRSDAPTALQELATRQESERAWATEYLLDLARQTKSPLDDLPGLDELLLSVVPSPNADLSAKACHALMELATSSVRARTNVDLIVERAGQLLAGDSASGQEEAVFALEQAGSAAEPAIGKLVAFLKLLVQLPPGGGAMGGLFMDGSGGGMGGSGGGMGGMGGGMGGSGGGMGGLFQPGRIVVWSLPGTFKSYSAEIRPAIIRTLGNIGPAASEAIPLLTKIYEEELESESVTPALRLGQDCLAAIKKIDPAAVPELYADKTLNQWLNALASASTVKDALDALKAVGELADTNADRQADIVRGVFQLSHRYGTRYIDVHEENGKVAMSALQLLLRMESPAIVAGMIEDVPGGTPQSFDFVQSLVEVSANDRAKYRHLRALEEQPNKYMKALITMADAPATGSSDKVVMRARILLARLAIWQNEVSPAHVSSLLRGYKDRQGGAACVLALANILSRDDATAKTLRAEQVPRQIVRQAILNLDPRVVEPDLIQALRQFLEGGFDLATLEPKRHHYMVEVLTNNLSNVYRHTIKTRGATGGVYVTIAGSESAMDPVYIEASKQYSGWYPSDVRLDLIKVLGMMGSDARDALPLLRKTTAEDLVEAAREAIAAIERPLVELREAIAKELPLANVELTLNSRSRTIELSGWIWHGRKSEFLHDLADQYFPGWQLINNLAVGHPQTFAMIAKDGMLYPVDASGILLSPTGISTEAVDGYPRIEIEGVELRPPALGEKWSSPPLQDALAVLNVLKQDAGYGGYAAGYGGPVWHQLGLKRIKLVASDYAPDVERLDKLYKTPLTFQQGVGLIGPTGPIQPPERTNTFLLSDQNEFVEYAWGHASQDVELNRGRIDRLSKIGGNEAKPSIIDVRWMKWPD